MEVDRIGDGAKGVVSPASPLPALVMLALAPPSPLLSERWLISEVVQLGGVNSSSRGKTVRIWSRDTAFFMPCPMAALPLDILEARRSSSSSNRSLSLSFPAGPRQLRDGDSASPSEDAASTSLSPRK
jgi:hypothetical protein